MTRRIVAITVAIVLAALGTVGGIYLVVSADSRARSAINDAINVAVASKPISINTTGKQVRDGYIEYKKYPRESVPSDALTDIPEDLDAKVMTSNVPAGRILTEANFGDPSQVRSNLPLPDGKMAVTVQTGVPEQVAGYVQPGSEIAIFLTYKPVRSGGNGVAGLEKTRVLLPRVTVLAVGPPKSDGTPGKSDGTSGKSGSLLLTVAVGQGEAERLIEGLSHGTLYLGLLTDSTTVNTTGGVDNRDDSSNSSSLFK